MFAKLIILITTKFAVLKGLVPDLFMFIDNITNLFTSVFRGILHFMRYEDYQTVYNILFVIVIFSISIWFFFYKDKD